MNQRRQAFTLIELLIVMGIILLFITMAVPVLRNLSGANSTSITINMMSAILTRAREMAIANQDVRGVLLLRDPLSDRIDVVIVMPAAIQDPNWSGYLLLDQVPSTDSLELPLGIRVQSVFNGFDPTAASTTSTSLAAANAATGKSDRYFGYNPISQMAAPGPVFLFDGNGKLISVPYGFQLSAPGSSVGTFQPSNLCKLFQFVPAAGPYSWPSGAPTGQNIISYGYPAISVAIIPGVFGAAASGNGTTKAPPPPPVFPVTSQLAMVVFDYDTFKTLGFSDDDAVMTASSTMPRPYSSAVSTPTNPLLAAESDEEAWIDNTSTPILINRQNGTLIRGE